MKIPEQELLRRLELPLDKKLDMVLDTDTYNEVDDQFALVYALRSVDRLNVQAIYAAPFFNERSNGPEDGMERSYDEILRVMDKMNFDAPQNFVFKGSTRYLEEINTPCHSAATEDLINRAMNATEPLYVVAIGAITNIASAILIEPRIIEKIVVVWLGGNALHWYNNDEFNFKQDPLSASVIFDCGVPLVHLPCYNVVTHLHTTLAELERYLDGNSEIATYLTQIVREFTGDHYCWSKVIWDVAAIAYLVNPNFVLTDLVRSPILKDELRWGTGDNRHFIRTAVHLNRDEIFRDLFTKISL